MTPLFTNDENGDRYINPYSRDDGLPKREINFWMALILAGLLIFLLVAAWGIFTAVPEERPLPTVRDEVWYREGYEDEWRKI